MARGDDDRTKTEAEKFYADGDAYLKAVVLRCQQDLDFAFRMRQAAIVREGGGLSEVGPIAHVYAQATRALDEVGLTLDPAYDATACFACGTRRS